MADNPKPAADNRHFKKIKEIKMSDMFTSIIRTWVPTMVGAVLSWLAVQGVELDAGTEQSLVIGLTGALTAVYYALARFLEQRFSWAGYLLGSKKQPSYKA